MKDKLYAAFRQIRMDPECAERIEKALNQPQPAARYTAMPFRENRRSLLTAGAAAVCLLAVMVFTIPALLGRTGPTTATEPPAQTESTPLIRETEPRIRETLPGEVEVDAFMGIRGDYEDLNFLSPEGDRLYFTANGQRTDITDRISDDVPYTYVYTDDSGIIHYIAVGGCYTPGSNNLDGVYYGYWFRNASQSDQRYSGWLDGGCKGHWCNAADDYFGWYVKACEILDIPWKPNHEESHHEEPHH